MKLPSPRLVLCAAVVLPLIAVGAWLFAGHDENYALQKLFFSRRYGRYDELIAQSATRYGVSPSLVKAVIWRESRFQPGMLGAHGERGLMQVTEGAAQDWAKAEKIETFLPADLLDPKTNIEAGSWYLANALKHWAAKDDPVPFALAEYNAGRTRVKRWEKSSGMGGGFGAGDLSSIMDFPATRAYVRSIVARHRDFQRAAEFPHDTPSRQ
ncbi:MAG: lytic transglycosylase domain-containing protein [Terrimicrobiaceae bacterium]